MLIAAVDYAIAADNKHQRPIVNFELVIEQIQLSQEQAEKFTATVKNTTTITKRRTKKPA